MRVWLIILVAGFILNLSTVAHTENKEEEAKAAFEFGKTWFNEGKYSEAADAFRRAYQLRPNWKIFYNLGQSEAAAKRHGLALRAFEAYLSQGGDEIPAERQEEVRLEIKKLRDLVGYIEVEAPRGAIVFVDDMERDRVPLPGPIAVAAGVDHQIVIEIDGKPLITRKIRIGGDKIIKITTEEKKKDEQVTQAEPMPQTDEEGVNGLRLAGWMTNGLGGAMLVVGIATGGKALSMNKDLKEACPDNECSQDHWGDMDKMHNLGVTSNVMLILGPTALIAGTIMVVISHRDDESEVDTALIPLATPDFVGASIQGRF